MTAVWQRIRKAIDTSGADRVIGMAVGTIALRWLERYPVPPPTDVHVTSEAAVWLTWIDRSGTNKLFDAVTVVFDQDAMAVRWGAHDHQDAVEELLEHMAPLPLAAAVIVSELWGG